MEVWGWVGYSADAAWDMFVLRRGIGRAATGAQSAGQSVGALCESECTVGTRVGATVGRGGGRELRGMRQGTNRTHRGCRSRCSWASTR